MDTVGSVTDTKVTRTPQPEPQRQPPPPPRREDQGGNGDVTPPNGMAMMGYGSGQALLGLQEAEPRRPVESTAKAADTSGDRKLARDELQKLYQQRMSDAAAAEKSAANTRSAGSAADNQSAKSESDAKQAAAQAAQRADANQNQQSAEELKAARQAPRSINIGA